MIKIVINRCHGGFGLSDKAKERHDAESSLAEEYEGDIQRDDLILVQIVEEMGKESWGKYAELKVVEIPDDVKWQIEEHTGKEVIHEKHRTWE